MTHGVSSFSMAASPREWRSGKRIPLPARRCEDSTTDDFETAGAVSSAMVFGLGGITAGPSAGGRGLARARALTYGSGISAVKTKDHASAAVAREVCTASGALAATNLSERKSISARPRAFAATHWDHL